MNEKAIQVGFLLGSPEISGGTYVIYEHGSRLKQAGYDVYMITEGEVTEDQYQWHPAAAELGWLSLEQAGRKNFDLIFATYWKSPFLLSQLKSSHYAYFVQSIESRFFGEPDPTNHDERDLDKWKTYCESNLLAQYPGDYRGPVDPGAISTKTTITSRFWSETVSEKTSTVKRVRRSPTGNRAGSGSWSRARSTCSTRTCPHRSTSAGRPASMKSGC